MVLNSMEPDHPMKTIHHRPSKTHRRKCWTPSPPILETASAAEN